MSVLIDVIEAQLAAAVKLQLQERHGASTMDAGAKMSVTAARSRSRSPTTMFRGEANEPYLDGGGCPWWCVAIQGAEPPAVAVARKKTKGRRSGQIVGEPGGRRESR